MGMSQLGISRLPRCEPTYEELKLDAFSDDNIETVVGCEPTYEELKLNLHCNKLP